MKICYKCKIEQPLNQFTKNKSKKDGFSIYCKMCISNRKPYFDARKEKKAKYDKLIYLKNREKVIKRSEIYYRTNKRAIFDYYRDKPKTDILFRLKKRIRSRIYKALKNKKKPNSVMHDLGCTLIELKKYLESLFKPGMTWENYGKWHIDHKIPLAKLVLTNPEQFATACHYTNLQPLWAYENISKGDKI